MKGDHRRALHHMFVAAPSAVANRRASPTIQAERGHFISTRPHYEQDVPESISGGSKNFCGQNV